MDELGIVDGGRCMSLGWLMVECDWCMCLGWLMVKDVCAWDG